MQVASGNTEFLSAVGCARAWQAWDECIREYRTCIPHGSLVALQNFLNLNLRPVLGNRMPALDSLMMELLICQLAIALIVRFCDTLTICCGATSTVHLEFVHSESRSGRNGSIAVLMPK